MFDELVSETLIGWIWILGSIGVVINGVLLIFAGGGLWGVLVALILIAVGLLVVRVACESLIVIFKIHDILKQSTHSLEQMERYQTSISKQLNAQSSIQFAHPRAPDAQAPARHTTAPKAPRLSQPAMRGGWESAYDSTKE